MRGTKANEFFSSFLKKYFPTQPPYHYHARGQEFRSITQPQGVSLEPNPSSHSSPDALAPTPGPSQDDCRSWSEQESPASTWAGRTEAKVFYNTEASPLSPRCAICRVPQWKRPHSLESRQCQGLGQCAFSWLAGLVDSGLPQALPLTAHHLSSRKRPTQSAKPWQSWTPAWTPSTAPPLGRPLVPPQSCCSSWR